MSNQTAIKLFFFVDNHVITLQQFGECSDRDGKYSFCFIQVYSHTLKPTFEFKYFFGGNDALN